MTEPYNRDRPNPDPSSYPDPEGYPHRDPNRPGLDPNRPPEPYPPHEAYVPPRGAGESLEDYNRRRQELQLEAEERRLRDESRRSEDARRDLITARLVNGVYFLVGALLALLALRFILRISGANIDNTFAQVIYGLSQPFVAPFSTLFISPTFGGDRYILDVNLLVAMLVYALLGLIVGRLIQVVIGSARD